MLCDFMHTGEEFVSWNDFFNKWCDKNNFKPIYAATIIYKHLPQLSGEGYDEWDKNFCTVFGTVNAYWSLSDENKEKCLKAIKKEMELDEAVD